MTHDYITPAERLRPPRRRLSNFLLEVWLRYDLRCSRFELEKFEEALKTDVASQWRDKVVKLKDKLAQLGVDPEQAPEDLTRMFEVYLVAGLLVAVMFGAWMFTLYRDALVRLIGG